MEDRSMIDAYFSYKDILGAFISHIEYEIQNFFFAVLMIGVIYNQYKIRKIIKEMTEN
jgi:uncharacterized membrane protein required for colicin V production